MKMESACEADNEAREQDRAAVNKVKLLPEVMTLLNRQNIQHAILDPETNFLQAVKFFLEPLIADGSLPSYNIQREIFTALTKMTIDKDTLYASGIGKVVLFYTKTKRAQPEIKRMAERLMGEWSRPILKRTDDYKKRQIEGRVVDVKYASPQLYSLPPPSKLSSQFRFFPLARLLLTKPHLQRSQELTRQLPTLVLPDSYAPPRRQEVLLRVRKACRQACRPPRARARQPQPCPSGGPACILHCCAHCPAEPVCRPGAQARGRERHGGVPAHDTEEDRKEELGSRVDESEGWRPCERGAAALVQWF